MAILNNDKFSIKIEPLMSPDGWVEFCFSFWYLNKPIFNPEIIRGNMFKADQLHFEGCALVSTLEAILDCRKDGEMFYWNAWEDEVMIEIKSFMKNIEGGMNGVFEITILIDEMFLKEGSQRHNAGFCCPAIRITADRQEIKKFTDELKSEMKDFEPS